MLKQINPEDLVEGQECYIKVKYLGKSISMPACIFKDIIGQERYFQNNQPIYTLDEKPNQPDPELEMLVNVATELMVNDSHFTEAEIEEELGHKLSEDKKERAKQSASAYKRLVAREAAELITACKKIKEGER